MSATTPPQTQPCDHHDQLGEVPETQSRLHILRQLAGAKDLADAVTELTRMGMIVRVERAGHELLAPTIEVDLDRFLTLWTQLQAWRRLEPQACDWDPPRSVIVP